MQRMGREDSLCQGVERGTPCETRSVVGRTCGTCLGRKVRVWTETLESGTKVERAEKCHDCKGTGVAH